MIGTPLAQVAICRVDGDVPPLSAPALDARHSRPEPPRRPTMRRPLSFGDSLALHARCAHGACQARRPVAILCRLGPSGRDPAVQRRRRAMPAGFGGHAGNAVTRAATAESVLPSLTAGHAPIYDIELLRALRGCRISDDLTVLCVIGAHRFDELPLIDKLFPALQHIYLFEPQAGPLQVLQALAAHDARSRVFPVAVSETDGTARFNVTSNDGESSSLLQLGSHRKHFPGVSMHSSIEVPTRRLDSVLAEHGLRPPDAMIVDVQGAEYLVLKSLSPAVLDRLRLVYTEVSLEPLYESARLLSDVEALLAPRFVNVGHAAIKAQVPVHGNAVFLRRTEVATSLNLSMRERLRRCARRLRQRWRQR